MLPKRFESRNYYEILGVAQDATRDEIAKTYRDLCRIYHPDSNYYADIIDDAPTPEHSDIFRIITDAYNTLIDDGSRARYNDQLFYKHHKRLTQVSAMEMDGVAPSITAKRKTGNLRSGMERENVLKVAPMFKQNTSTAAAAAPYKNIESEWADSVPSISEILRNRTAPASTFGPLIGGVLFGLAVGAIALALVL